MHLPSPGSQSIESVIADLQAQKARIDGSIAWVQGIRDGILACGGKVEFTNLDPVLADTTEARIALVLPLEGRFQDIPVFTLLWAPSPADVARIGQEPGLLGTAARLETLLAWQSRGIRPFETHLVSVRTLWAGSEVETQALLAKLVREWFAHWFPNPPKVAYRVRSPKPQPLGVRPPQPAPAG